MTILAIAATVCLLAHGAQMHTAPSVAAVLEVARRPVPLRTGIGSAHDAVSAASPDAQAFYDQGLAYLHSYVWLEAARSFNQALRLDPNLAMAHAGLTIAYIELNAPAAARDALSRAKSLTASANEHDRVHLALRELQVAAASLGSGSSRTPPPAALASYRSALDAALAKYPNDEELWLARGVAESPDPADRGQGSVAGSILFYQKALTVAPQGFAAHHYLIHAYENTARTQDALAEGATYARLAPDIPHARHMHGHDLRRVGRIEEAIAEFRAAAALESSYFEHEGIPPEYDWHHHHNLDLLATSYQHTGQMRNAEPLLKSSFAMPSSLVVQEFNKRAWTVFLRARSRVDEALAAARVLAGHRSPLVSASGHVEMGRAFLMQGRFKEAADEANTALRLMRDAPEGAGLVATPLQALQGEFFLRTGQRDKARAALEAVTRQMRAAAGPDAWAQATFEIEAIARAAREVGDWNFASWAARQMIEHDASYAGAHYALALVADHGGDSKTAREEFELAAKYWKNADADLPEFKRMMTHKDR